MQTSHVSQKFIINLEMAVCFMYETLVNLLHLIV